MENLKLDDKFILNYRVKKDKIIIKYINVEKCKVDKSNIDLVNLIMEKQIKDLDKEEIEKQEDKLTNKTLMFSVLIIIGILATFAFSFHSLFYCFIFGTFTVFNAFITHKYITKLTKINDILKKIEFIENERIINKELKNKNVLINSPKKVKKIVKKRKDKPAFDIKNIDDLSYVELKELLKLIENIKYLISKEEVEELDKGKQLTMKKPN